MGNSQSIQFIQKINFEDVQTVYRNPEVYVLINTMSENEQGCLIPNTISITQEETLINNFVKHNKSARIVIYGKNSNDDKLYKKYKQLMTLGFTNVHAYIGGMFEWLLLQDIYGFDEFPTTVRQLDFLKYKPGQKLNVGLIRDV